MAKGLAAVISKALDSAQSGFLKNVLTGAGLTLASTAGVMTLLNQYIGTIKSGTSSFSYELLALMHLSGFDYALSIVLSALVSRATMNTAGLTLSRIKK